MSPPPPQDVSLASSPREWILQNARPHEPAVRGYLQTAFPAVDADDVVQESYLKLLRARTTGHIASAKAYFFSIARNTAITLFRRSTLYAPTPVDQLPEACVVDEAIEMRASIDAADREALVVQAIAALPERCGQILEMAVLHGRSNAEIARELGLAEATVRVQLARGMKRIVEFLRRRGERS